MGSLIPESFARRIFEVAIEQERCSEVLDCLFDGGSVTLDSVTGDISLATAEQLGALING